MTVYADRHKVKKFLQDIQCTKLSEFIKFSNDLIIDSYNA